MLFWKHLRSGLMACLHLVALKLSDEERLELVSLSSRRKTAQALALRARIVLACADGAGNDKEIAAAMGLNWATVGKWRRRFAERRAPWKRSWDRRRALEGLHPVRLKPEGPPDALHAGDRHAALPGHVARTPGQPARSCLSAVNIDG
jgi:hypothetical protein